MKDFVLNWDQKKILKNLSFLNNYGFYLAGGTALALYFGHRTSKDLDFYTKKDFNSFGLVKEFQKIFKKDLKESKIAENSLWLKVKNTDLSFFKYPYPLIGSLSSYETIRLASLKDVIAMKIEAIIGRGKKRDFIDIYFVIKKYGLEKTLGIFKEKYPYAFNEYSLLTALSYFEEAEKKQDRARINLFDPKVNWGLVKKYLIKEITNYQRKMIKK